MAALIYAIFFSVDVEESESVQVAANAGNGLGV